MRDSKDRARPRRGRSKRPEIYLLVILLSLSCTGCLGNIMGMLKSIPIIGGLFSALGGMFGAQPAAGNQQISSGAAAQQQVVTPAGKQVAGYTAPQAPESKATSQGTN